MITSNRKVTTSELRNLIPMQSLEILDINIDKVLVAQQGAFVILSSGNSQVVYPLNSMEGTMLTFIRSGCIKMGHIHNIYQIYVQTMKEIGCSLKSSTIEAKEGDVYYARLCWEDRNNKQVFNTCSVGDALILSAIAGSELKIVRRVLEDMENAEDLMDYQDDIFDD